MPWLGPYPDVDLPAPSSEEPEARIESAEATRLAFIATMQLLPARQRAVLLLRDVLIVKLPQDRVQACIGSGQGLPFAPNERVFRE